MMGCVLSILLWQLCWPLASHHAIQTQAGQMSSCIAETVSMAAVDTYRVIEEQLYVDGNGKGAGGQSLNKRPDT